MSQAPSTAHSEPKPQATSASAVKKTKIHLREETPIESDIPTFEVSYGEKRDFSLLKKNPLVPAGALLTGVVLMGGLLAFRSGNQRLSQQLMRARIFAQGATLCVLAGSVVNIKKAEQFPTKGNNGSVSKSK